MYSYKNGELEVFLVHPGGPFFEDKDEGYWGIPKGLVDDGEDLLNAARREFEEETSITPESKFFSLGTTVQSKGKIVHAWAFQSSDQEEIEIKSNTFDLEWPPGSGLINKYPEVDRGKYYSVDEAKVKIYEPQKVFIDRLEDYLVKQK